MKLFVSVLGIMLFTSVACAGDEVSLKNERDKVSYSIGIDIGNNMKKQSIDVDPDIVSRGIKDALSGNNPLMTEQEVRDAMGNFRKEMMEKQKMQMKAAGENNRKEGEAFLAENTKKEGVKTLKSGLQYKILKEGSGAQPKAADTVTVNYRGTLLDGTEFDSSYKRGQPAKFQLDKVIAGWTEALQLMNPGSKWQLFIPSDLAYGERGAGRAIGPDATLIFDVELLSIEESSGK